MRMFPNNSKSVHSVKEKYDSSETTEIYTVQILYISVNNLNWTELKYPNHRSNRAQQGSRCAQGKPGFQGILPLKKEPGSEVRSEAISDEVTSGRSLGEIQLSTYVFAACTYIVCFLVELIFELWTIKVRSWLGRFSRITLTQAWWTMATTRIFIQNF